MNIKHNFNNLDLEDKRIISLIISILLSSILGFLSGYIGYYDSWGKRNYFGHDCKYCYVQYFPNYTILISSLVLFYCITYLVLKKIEFQSINFNKEEALTKQQLKTTKNIYNDIIKNFRKIANENNIAPSHKTGDFKIISIYKMVESEIKKQFDSEYQKLSQEEVNRIVLILINIYELEGDKALNEKIKTLKTVMTKDLKDFENHIPY